MLHSSSVWLGHVEAPRQPAPREINARRCRRRGSCSPSVASHGARGSERSEGASEGADVFHPSLALKSGAASRREAARRVRQSSKGSAAPSSQKPATSTYLISGFRAIFAAGFRGFRLPATTRRGSFAHDKTLPTRRAALDAHAPERSSPSQAQPPQDHGHPRHARRRRPPPPLPEC